MPSVRKVKRRFCCTRSRAEILWCGAPQSVRSSHSLKMQEQLPWLSLSQWMLPPRRAPTSSLPSQCRCASNLSNLHVKRRAKGRAADAADTESFSYTRATKALLCLTACLSLTRCIYLPLPRPFSSTWLTSFNISLRCCPDPAPLSALFALPSFVAKTDTICRLNVQLCGWH